MQFRMLLSAAMCSLALSAAPPALPVLAGEPDIADLENALHCALEIYSESTGTPIISPVIHLYEGDIEPGSSSFMAVDLSTPGIANIAFFYQAYRRLFGGDSNYHFLGNEESQMQLCAAALHELIHICNDESGFPGLPGSLEETCEELNVHGTTLAILCARAMAACQAYQQSGDPADLAEFTLACQMFAASQAMRASLVTGQEEAREYCECLKSPNIDNSTMLPNGFDPDCGEPPILPPTPVCDPPSNTCDPDNCVFPEDQPSPWDSVTCSACAGCPLDDEGDEND